MKKQVSEIRVQGLSRRQQFGLAEEVPDALIRFEEQESTIGHYGEPSTIAAVIVITAASISGLVAWLAKEGLRQGKDLDFEAEIRLPGGGVATKLRLKGRDDRTRLIESLRHVGLVPPGEDAQRK